MVTILSATEFEIDLLKNKLTREIDEVNFLVTGIGILKSTISFYNYLKNNYNKQDIFINIGIAGGYPDKVSFLDICFAKQEILADFGVCYDNRIEYFSDIPETITIENNLHKFLYENINFNCTGNFLTVNSVTTNSKLIDFYNRTFNPVCENMEGFALSLLCKKFNLNFAEIRVISNYIGDRNNWRTKEAVEKLNEFIFKVILLLNEKFSKI